MSISAFRQIVHDASPALHFAIRAQTCTWNTGLRYSGHHEFQVAQRDFGQAIFERKHLALLGYANAPVDRAGWLAQDSFVDGASTAPNRSTTSMKQGNADGMMLTKRSQAKLRPV